MAKPAKQENTMRIRIHSGLSAVNYTFVDLIAHTDADLRPAFA